MTTTKNLVLDRIKGDVEAAGFVFVHDPEWANTGVIRAVEPGKVSARHSVYYSFQPEYAELRPRKDSTATFPGGHGYARYSAAAFETLVEAAARYLINNYP